ncbi:MAG: methyltransferase domain-containing protein [Candidatus Acidiferrales bacterium]
MTTRVAVTLEECRRFYSQEIRFAANISSAALVEAYANVPREKYLGPPPWQIASPEQRAMSLASSGNTAYTPTEDPRDLYHNVLVGLDIARNVNNGQPSALARWIDAMGLQPGDRAYHLGCGVGYYTAIIREVVGATGSVVAIDALPELAARAKENLAHYTNVTVRSGDGVTLDPGPCDAMLINAGVIHPHVLWLDRLNERGRLVVPLTMAATPLLGQGIMAKIVHERGGFTAQIATFLAIFSCTNGRDPKLEPSMAKALTSGALMKIKSIRRDSHEAADTCILHAPGVCLSMIELSANHEAAAS